jgi:hypothetical protein
MTRRNSLMAISLLVVLLVFHQVCSGSTSLESLVPQTGSEGWVLKAQPETFNKETLFEHIDGQAELFFHYGFEQSVFVIYQDVNSPESNIDVDIYDMGNPLQAFGIFSRFRQTASPAGIGTDSEMGEHNGLFCKGKYFVMLQATDASAAALKHVAQTVASRIADTSPLPKEIAYFPPAGLKSGSMEYHPSGLLGHEFLKRGFKATYTEQAGVKDGGHGPEKDRDFQLFLCMFENPHDAAEALKSFKEVLAKKGRLDEDMIAELGTESRSGADPYQGKVIVALKGPYLVGAVGFENLAEVRVRLVELVRRMP